eukprot:4988656-Amphidinium_carterae.1
MSRIAAIDAELGALDEHKAQNASAQLLANDSVKILQNETYFEVTFKFCLTDCCVLVVQLSMYYSPNVKNDVDNFRKHSAPSISAMFFLIHQTMAGFFGTGIVILWSAHPLELKSAKDKSRLVHVATSRFAKCRSATM